jgi:hypothetical protein
MGVLNIYSPNSMVGSEFTTQYIQNPWGTPNIPASDVCFQRWISQFEINSPPSIAGFGIIEFEFIGDQGIQQTTFGDVTDLSDVQWWNLPTRMFVPQMLSVTLAFLPYGSGRDVLLASAFGLRSVQVARI